MSGMVQCESCRFVVSDILMTESVLMDSHDKKLNKISKKLLAILLKIKYNKNTN